MEEIKQLEEIVNCRFEKEEMNRKETEKQLVAFIDERSGVLQNEILRQFRDRNEGVTMLESELETDFPKLQDCNKAESHERQEQDALLIKRVVEECDTITKNVTAERRAREESEEQVLDLIKGMVETIRSDLNTEKQTREQSEEQLLQLLEDTCTKLNQASKLE